MTEAHPGYRLSLSLSAKNKLKWITLTILTFPPKCSNLHLFSVTFLAQCCDWGVEEGHYRIPASWWEMASWFCHFFWVFRLIGCYLLAEKKLWQKGSSLLAISPFPHFPAAMAVKPIPALVGPSYDKVAGSFQMSIKTHPVMPQESRVHRAIRNV